MEPVLKPPVIPVLEPALMSSLEANAILNRFNHNTVEQATVNNFPICLMHMCDGERERGGKKEGLGGEKGRWRKR